MAEVESVGVNGEILAVGGGIGDGAQVEGPWGVQLAAQKVRSHSWILVLLHLQLRL